MLTAIETSLARLGKGGARYHGASDPRWDDGLLYPTPVPWSRPAEPADRIHAVGSCFARDMERCLNCAGMTVTEDRAVATGIVNTNMSTGAANDLDPAVRLTFCVAQIAQRLEWVTKGWPSEAGLFAAGANAPGHVMDAVLAGGPHLPRGDALRRRERIAARERDVLRADIVLIAPETTDSIYDRETGLHLQKLPPRSVLTADPGRFAHSRLDVRECVALLRGPIEVLAARGAFVVLAVSPSMLTSGGGTEPILSDGLAKSTLRVALEELLDVPGTAYFPAYEIMRSAGPGALRENGIHPRPEVMHAVARHMLEAYGRLRLRPRASEPTRHARAA